MNEVDIFDDPRTGVYCIRNVVVNKVYIGSAAISFKKRMKEHLKSLKEGTHCNAHLQSSWMKYGEEAFEFSILEVCSREDCLVRETDWITQVGSTSQEIGYNICSSGWSKLGVPVSEETRAKIGAANAVALKGKRNGPRSDATKLKLSKAHTGKVLSTEHKQKLALAKLSRSWSILRRMAQCRKSN